MKMLNLFLIACLSFSCSSSNDKILKEATQIHEESLEIEKEISKKFDSLEQVSNSINIQGRALTDEEIKFTREIELLGLSLDYWQENHLDVPQNGELGKNNRSTVKFSAKDILTIQKEFNDSILAIQARLKTINIPSN